MTTNEPIAKRMRGVKCHTLQMSFAPKMRKRIKWYMHYAYVYIYVFSQLYTSKIKRERTYTNSICSSLFSFLPFSFTQSNAHNCLLTNYNCGKCNDMQITMSYLTALNL